jgi:hypothetical protein
VNLESGVRSDLSDTSRRLLLPSYTKCIQKPNFRAGGEVGDCSILHEPSESYYMSPTKAFREMDTVTIDASRCQPFIDDFSLGSRAKLSLQPFEVKLRPWSTDHDVFLQVNHPRLHVSDWYRLGTRPASCRLTLGKHCT